MVKAGRSKEGAMPDEMSGNSSQKTHDIGWSWPGGKSTASEDEGKTWVSETHKPAGTEDNDHPPDE